MFRRFLLIIIILFKEINFDIEFLTFMFEPIFLCWVLRAMKRTLVKQFIQAFESGLQESMVPLCSKVEKIGW